MSIASCRYPEGPNFTLKSKKSRLSGIWDVESIDGQSADNVEYFYEFEKDGDGRVSAYGFESILTWIWEDKKSSLSITTESDVSDFNIQKLTDEDMIWKDETGIEWILAKR
jgi:hypothetical protein